LDKSQGRACRYCGHLNKSEKAQDCVHCGGSLAPVQPPPIRGTEPPDVPVRSSTIPTLVVAVACIAVVGLALVIPLPGHANAHPAKHQVQGQFRSHTVSFAPAEETIAESAAPNPAVDGCERSRLDSNAAIEQYKNGKYFEGFVKADTAVKLAQLSCPRALKPLRLGYALSARAFNGRHLDSVDPRMDFEEANDNLNSCSSSPQVYGAATASACAQQQQRNIAASQGLDSRKVATSA
jgi:hypothetical protein